ncbi:MAG TPA: BACON domain-containing carbohydrate-binding protein, partial [Candidatus Binatia bacterium]|nr:BACON domain-containing carbohydrate-binding protein [Candidatus Binatia bacterium]
MSIPDSQRASACLALGLALLLFLGLASGAAAQSGSQVLPTATCASTAYSLSKTTAAFGMNGGTGNVSVNTTASCDWTSTSPASWVTIASGQTGIGGGLVTFTVDGNPAATARSATLTIAGKPFTVTQSACTYAIAPASAPVQPAGGNGSVTVTTGDACGWSSTSPSTASWLTITAGQTGSGSGPVNYNVAANTGTAARTASLTIAGKTFTVTQSACTYTLGAAAGPAFGMNGGTGSVALTTQDGCAWPSTSPATAPWLTITSASPQAGSGAVSYSVAGNTGTAARSAALTIAGKPFNVSQAGCTYTLDNLVGTSFPPIGGDGTVGVTTGDACGWTNASPATAPWLAITSGATRTGNGSVMYTVGPNTSGAARTASLAIAGKAFKVSQATCVYTLGAATAPFGVNGGGGSVPVTTQDGCPWTSVNAPAWIAVTSASPQTGNGSVTYTVAPNSTTTARTATLTIAAKPYKVTQAGCTYALGNTVGTSFPPIGGNGTVGVTTGDACPWANTSPTTASWLTITSDATRTGNGSVTYTVGPNPSGAARTAVLTIAAKPFKVSQAACVYALSAAFATPGVDGGNGAVSVTTQDGCPWNVTNVTNIPAWTTLTSPLSQVGNGSVTYTVAPNPTTAARTAILTVATKPYKVIQSPCAFTLDSTGATLPPAAGGGTVNVTTGTACTWGVTGAVPPWVTVPPATNTGSGPIAYTVLANTTTAPRTASLTIGGKPFKITQANCTYAASPTGAVPVPRAGMNASVAVTTFPGCPWTTTTSMPAFVTISSPSPQSGNGSALYTVASNTTGLARTATLTVAGKTLNLSQPGCSYALDATSASFTVEGADGSVGVTTESDCKWSSPSPVTWITMNSAVDRTGGGTVSYTVAPNPTPGVRSATLQIAGKTYTVKQSAAAATADLRISLQPPGDAFTGKGLPAPSTVKNFGSQPSGPFDVGLFVSPTNQAGAGMLLRSVHISNLPPGASQPLDLNALLPNDLVPGDYYMSAIADTSHRVTQPNGSHAAVVGPFKIGRGVDKVKSVSASIQLTVAPPIPGFPPPTATCSLVVGSSFTLSGSAAITQQTINPDDSVTAKGSVTLSGPSAAFNGTFTAMVDFDDHTSIVFDDTSTLSIPGFSGTVHGATATGNLKFSGGAGPGGAGGALGFAFESDTGGFKGTLTGTGCAFTGSFKATVDQIFELVFLNFLDAGAFGMTSATPTVKFPVPFTSYEPVLSVIDTPFTLPAAGAVVFSGPDPNLSGVPGDASFSDLDQADGFAVYLTPFISSTTGPPDGHYSVTYKGVARPFDVSIDASNRAVIPFPTIALNPVGDLQKVTWQYRNRQTGAPIAPPAFVGVFGVLISTVNSNGTLDFCSSPFFTDRNILSFTLSPTAFCANAIHWANVFSLDFIYVDSLSFGAYGVSYAGPRQAFPQLALAKTGPGTITSSPAGISCGPTCATALASFARGTTVTLTATPSASAVFLGWTGDCSGYGTSKTCILTMSDDRAVGAAFGASPQARFLNNICFRPVGSPTCNAFTATLKSSVGASLTWSSSSG